MSRLEVFGLTQLTSGGKVLDMENHQPGRRKRNVAFTTTAEIQRALRLEADRQAERLDLGGAELRGSKFLLNRIVREFLACSTEERDRRVDEGLAMERGGGARYGAGHEVKSGESRKDARRA